ncbi:MAG: tRNA (adenosine(37)-N6)-threonylcarbamoyltransferase complex transferase subunit TsaD [Candidatus Omnitrophica bacterium]|nr:tRNA (adenosine(37)-N6)-threonylcarbamoyltransferase complex transferase subunit TsaD [Candidatus Omnitrophota bacterium]
MIVLGVESSCDETGVAVVRDGKKILSNVVASSLKIHSKHGGVVPEIASRMQLESIAGVFSEAIKIAKIRPEQIDLISVTAGPGLPGSLLVGISFAKALALSLDRPILGINHIHSHVYANLLCHHNIKTPCVALVVSGGHTTLFYIEDFSKIKILGQTCDDACGEAFDKVAKIMGMGYPGGPLIEKLAKGADGRKIKFACCGTDNELDFSFSGIKTAVLYYLKDKKAGKKIKKDLAASFQESAVNALIRKSLLACKRKGVKNLLIGGGVVANSCLRQKFAQSSKKNGINCFFPSINLCLDNAAMVAGLADYLYKQGLRSSLNLNMEFN